MVSEARLSADARIDRGLARQLAARRRRLAAGAQSLGWKVGFGAPAAMRALAIAAPLTGYLLREALLADGATVSLAGWTKPAAEAEIAVHMGADLAAGADRAAARAAIAGIGPAIELADVTFPPDDVERILDGNIYQRHVILGPCDTRRAGARLDGVRARIARDGASIADTDDPQALTGELIDIVRHVAGTLAAQGERLCAGEVIITGSITPPIWVRPGERLEFELAPLGRLAVGFV